MNHSKTKYCTECDACTMGEGFEEGLCDECWEARESREQDRERILDIFTKIICLLLVIGFAVGLFHNYVTGL